MLRIALVAGMLAAAALLAAGCQKRQAEEKPIVTDEPQPSEAPKLQAPTAEEIAAAAQAGTVEVALETDKGLITLEIDGAAAPAAAANFLNLVQAGFYDGMPFHRVEPGFVIQAGDPTLVGRPPVGYTIPDERSPIEHHRGTIAMGRIFSGGRMVADSASTQFYICLGDAPHLDDMGFTAFGRASGDLGVIDEIRIGDVIIKATLRQAGSP